MSAASTCPVCGGREADAWKQRNLERDLVPDDLLITDARYGVTLSLLKCRGCGFIFAEDSEMEHLTALYEELSDPAYEEGEEFRGLQMRWILELAKRAKPDAKSLLDVGAAAGLLLREARDFGFEAEGVEPSASLVATARASGVVVHQGVLPHDALADRRFDIVSAIDVIEHVADPVELIRVAASYLAPGGVLAVVTPDIGSLAARMLGPRWWHLRLAHVCYFDRNSLDRAVAACGLRVIARRRAKWFFEAGYLADRMGQYLPVAGLNRVLRKLPGIRALYDLVIPLNLGDSFFLLLERDDAAQTGRP
jgi:2-polyprenyl-3-methyl-5-hydroxy-6-metoxy-1,4-benzoquinol methylase